MVSSRRINYKNSQIRHRFSKYVSELGNAPPAFRVNVRYFSSDHTIPCTRANMCVVNLCANSSTGLQGIRHVYHFIRADEMRKARIFQERMVLFPCLVCLWVPDVAPGCLKETKISLE